MPTYTVPTEYATISLAIAAIPSDLLGTGVHEIIVRAGEYEEVVDISGFTNASASDRIELKSDIGHEHKGNFEAGVRVVSDLSTSLGMIRLQTPFTEALDIVARAKTDAVTNTPGFRINASDCKIENALSATIGGPSFDVEQTNGVNAKIFKCAAFNDRVLSNNSGRGFQSRGDTLLYNCVSLGFRGNAFWHGKCINCVSYNQDGFVDFFENELDSSNNASRDASAPGSGSLTNLSLEEMGFVNAESPDATMSTYPDFHLGTGSSLIAEGADLLSDFTTDIDGDTIPSSFYPIGFDYNGTVFFVDFGTNTQLSTAPAASGLGSKTDPMNFKAWHDRVKRDTGTGTNDDVYNIKGSATLDAGVTEDVQITRIAELKAWSLPDFGPWRIRSEFGGLKIGPVTLDATPVRDAIIVSTSNFGITWRTHFFNCYINADGSIVGDGTKTDVVFEGSTVIGGFSYNQFTGIDFILRDSVFYSQAVATGSLGAFTATNCVFSGSKSQLESDTGVTVSDTGCQFNFVPNETPVTDYLESDPDEFKVDSAVTINGSGIFTNIPTGLFGHRRTEFNISGQGSGIGGHFFPLELIVDSNGTKDFTSINDAIAAIPQDLTSLYSKARISILAGVYNEIIDLDSGSFSGESATRYLQFEAFPGDEHKGIFGSGVVIQDNTASDIINCLLDYTIFQDLELNNEGSGNVYDVRVPNARGKRLITQDVSGTGDGFLINGGTELYLCLAVGLAGDGFRALGTGTNTARNCNAHGCNNGFSAISVVNCVASSNVVADYVSLENPQTTSVSTDGTQGTTQRTLSEIAYVDAGSLDFHIKTTSLLDGAGTDQSAFFTKDIDCEMIMDWMIGFDYPFLSDGALVGMGFDFSFEMAI